MSNDIKRTFDVIEMSAESKERVEVELIKRLSGEGEQSLNTKILAKRKTKILAVAATLLISLTLVAFAYGDQIFKTLTGSVIETGIDESGTYKKHTVNAEYEKPPAEVVNGKIIFTLDGSNSDITSYCSQTAFYTYETIDEKNWKQVIVVGGTPDNMGYAVFIYNEKGKFEASHGSQGVISKESSGDYKFQWYETAKQKYIYDFLPQ